MSIPKNLIKLEISSMLNQCQVNNQSFPNCMMSKKMQAQKAMLVLLWEEFHTIVLLLLLNCLFTPRIPLHLINKLSQNQIYQRNCHSKEGWISLLDAAGSQTSALLLEHCKVVVFLRYQLRCQPRQILVSAFV